MSDDPLVQQAAATFDEREPATFRAPGTARLAAQDRAGIPKEQRSPLTRDEALRLTEPLARAQGDEKREVLTGIETQLATMFGRDAGAALAFVVRVWAAEAEASGQ